MFSAVPRHVSDEDFVPPREGADDPVLFERVIHGPFRTEGVDAVGRGHRPDEPRHVGVRLQPADTPWIVIHVDLLAVGVIGGIPPVVGFRQEDVVGRLMKHGVVDGFSGSGAGQEVGNGEVRHGHDQSQHG